MISRVLTLTLEDLLGQMRKYTFTTLNISTKNLSLDFYTNFVVFKVPKSIVDPHHKVGLANASTT